jgi:hypothetical protein
MVGLVFTIESRGEIMIKREAAIVTVSIAIEGYIETCLQSDEYEEDRKELDAAFRALKSLSLIGSLWKGEVWQEEHVEARNKASSTRWDESEED